ncbi:hypothetical protein GOARA_012_01050 [Gordonia araii NBRC 100433]|uniref:Uncharacterized protein n=1 Tax=Gordonia araii NBRC 100433 TaxID=1073574 RepID=G7GY79_9ACTN|nr:hypothetical protein GOARA_012_01050 [Gordonia araii NBRC 100433]
MTATGMTEPDSTAPVGISQPPSTTIVPRRRWRWIAGLAAVVLTVGTGLGVVLAVVSGGSGTAHADALCDQMRREHGPYWPCINVPTYTPQPTQNTPPPTGSTPGAPGNGPNAGGSPGPGPGTGNGTPIIPVPGYRAPGLPGQRPPAPPQQTGQRPAPPNTGQPAPPAQTGRPAPRTPAVPGPKVQQPARPAPVTVPGPALAPIPGPASTDSIPTAVWLLVGAAALTAAPARHSVSRFGFLKKLWNRRKKDKDKKDDKPKNDSKPAPKPIHPDSSRIREIENSLPRSRARIREVKNEDELRAVYERMSHGSKPAQAPGTYNGTLREFPDGTKVGWRNSNKSGSTIDIWYADTGKWVRIHTAK